MAKIGFVGLGNMGAPMAANLIKAGHEVTGYDLSPAALDALRVAGGRFEGPKLRGIVLPGGADWIIGRPDGSTSLDMRIVLETDDGAAIGVTCRGMRHGREAVVTARFNAGVLVEPAEYYFRTSVAFDTAAPKYDWLNRVIAIGTGSRPPEGPVYEIFEVL